MKQIKLLTPLLIGSTLLLLNACGGGSSSSTSKTETAKNVTEAQKNFKAMSAFSSMSSSIASANSTSSTKLQKTQSNNCSNGGSTTFTYDETSNVVTLSFSSCKEENTFINGTMIMTQSDDERYTNIQFKNLTIDDGKSKMTSTHLTFKEDAQEHWSTMDGDIKIVAQCFRGNFTFETIAKMYDAQDGSDNVESGILKMNDATYTFANPYVTIKAGGEERTLLQTELEKEMNDTNGCSE